LFILDWPGHNVSRSSSLPHKDEQVVSFFMPAV